MSETKIPMSWPRRRLPAGMRLYRSVAMDVGKARVLATPGKGWYSQDPGYAAGFAYLHGGGPAALLVYVVTRELCLLLPDRQGRPVPMGDVSEPALAGLPAGIEQEGSQIDGLYHHPDVAELYLWRGAPVIDMAGAYALPTRWEAAVDYISTDLLPEMAPFVGKPVRPT